MIHPNIKQLLDKAGYAYLIEVCAGCGSPVADERDCGCPAGTKWVHKYCAVIKN